MIPAPYACPHHGRVNPQPRGVRLGEVLGVLVITFLTCGLGGILIVGLIPLARRPVCPLCSSPVALASGSSPPEDRQALGAPPR